MLALRTPNSRSSVDCNLLPCQIKHTGAADASQKHWEVTTEENGSKTAYFRGRKLVGKDVKLPEGYSGLVIENTDEVVPSAAPVDEDENDTEKEVETKVFNGVASFEKITIWGHESVGDEDGNGVLKGINEWMGLASKIHTYDMEEESA